MHRRMARILTTGAAMAAATALAAAPAAAVPKTIDVTNPNPDGHFTASSNETLLTDATTSAEFRCVDETDDEDGDGTPGEKASDAGGTIPTATYSIPPDANVGSVTSLVFNNCTSFFGPVNVDAIGTHDPYSIEIQNYPGEDENGNPVNGDGYIDDVVADITTGPCSFTVTGDAPAYYVNDGTAGELHLTAQPSDDVTLPDGPLTASNVDGCSGLVNKGDVLTYESVYTLTDPTNPSITVSGP